MKFAVVGAGAIGGFAGAMLARAGEDVALIARGAHLRAIQQNGIRVRGNAGEFETRVVASDEPQQIGPVDVVLLTLKAHSLTGIAPRLAPLMSADTCVVSAQNGLPWWYFYRHGGELEGTQLETIDPGGIIARHIESSRVVGCIVYPSTIIVEPGVIEHIEGNRFSLGEPDGSKSERCRRIADAFIRAGLRAPIRTDIRHEMWVKLMGNIAFNPISALSRATLAEIVGCSDTYNLSREIMLEAGAVAKRLGIELEVTPEQRLAGAEKVGHHKTSMLQDVEARRPMELEAIVGVVLELGQKLGIKMPFTQGVYACAKLLDQRIRSGESS